MLKLGLRSKLMPTLSRWLRRLLIVFGIVVFCFAAVFLFIRIQFPPSQWATIISSELEKRLHAAVSLQDIDYTLSGGLNLKGFIIYDAPQNEKKPTLKLVQLDEIVIYPRLLPLLNKKIEIASIYLGHGELFLSKTKTGYNWQRLPFFADKKASEKKDKESKNTASHGGWTIETDKLPKLKITRLKFVTNLTWLIDATLSGNKTSTQIELSVQEQGPSETASAIQLNADLAIPFSKAGLQELREKHIKGGGNVRLTNITPAKIPQIPNKGISYLNGDIDFQGDDNILKANLKQFTIMQSRLPSPARINGEISLKGSLISSQGLTVAIDSGVLLSQVNFEYMNSLQNLSLVLDADLNKVGALLKKEGFSGQIKGPLSLINGKITADLQIENFGVRFGGRQLFEGANLKTEIRDNKIAIPPVLLNIFGQPITLSVQGQKDNNGFNLTYTLRANEVSLSDLLNRLHTSTEKQSNTPGDIHEQPLPIATTQKSTPLPLSIRGTIDVAKLNYGKTNFTNLTAEAGYLNSTIFLRNLHFIFSGANVKGEYSLALPNDAHDFSLSFLGLKPNLYFETADISTRWFTSISGSLKGSMQGRGTSEFQKTLKANLRIESGRGRLVNSSMQRGFVKGVLGPLEDRLSAIEYQRAALEVSAAENKLFIKQATFNADDITLRILGSLDWQSQADMIAELRFKDSFIRDVANPLQLGITDVKRGEWYVLPFSCQGVVTETKCWQQEW